MALTITWSVKWGNITTMVDFTSRVKKITINQNAPVGQFGIGSATIELNNNDGAFTPRGGGTYSSTDWLSRAIFIDATIPWLSGTLSAQVFHGFISDLDIVDDGLQSTVIFSCVDTMTFFCGRNIYASYIPGSFTSIFTEPLDSASDIVLNGYANTPPFYNDILFGAVAQKTIFPDLGKTSGYLTYRMNQLDLSNSFLENDYADTIESGYASGITLNNVSAMDLMNTFFMPINQTVAWSTNITLIGGVAYYGYTRVASLAMTPFFREDIFLADAKNLNSTSFPFLSMEMGYNNTELYTSSTIGRAVSGTTAQTSTSLNESLLYGNRNISNSNVALESDAYALRTAGIYANRFKTPRFSPKSVSFSAKQIQQLATHNESNENMLYYGILDISYGLWQRCEITWQGKSVPTDTYASKVRGRQISITPTDAIFTYDLVPAVDYSTFILDADKIVNSSKEEQLGIRTTA
jgi:hypothetical protein